MELSPVRNLPRHCHLACKRRFRNRRMRFDVVACLRNQAFGSMSQIGGAQQPAMFSTSSAVSPPSSAPVQTYAMPPSGSPSGYAAWWKSIRTLTSICVCVCRVPDLPWNQPLDLAAGDTLHWDCAKRSYQGSGISSLASWTYLQV